MSNTWDINMHHRRNLHHGLPRVRPASTTPFSTNVDSIYTLQERYKEMVEDEMSLVTSPSSLYADRCSSATLNATKNSPPFRSIRLCSSSYQRSDGDENDESENDTVVDPYTLERTLEDIVRPSSMVNTNDLATKFHDDLDDIDGCNNDDRIKMTATISPTTMMSCRPNIVPTSLTKTTIEPTTIGHAHSDTKSKKKSRCDSHDDEDDDGSIDVEKLNCSFNIIVTLSSSWRMTDDEYVDTTTTTTDENSSKLGEKERQKSPQQRKRSPHRGHRRSRNMAMTGQEFWDQVLKEV